MKKISKVLLGIIAIAMIITIVYYLYSSFIDNPLVENNVLQSSNRNQKTSDIETSEQTVDENLPMSLKNIGILPYSGNTKNIGETFELINDVDGLKMQCCVNNVIFTKEAIDTDAGYYVDDNEKIQFDASCNILNEFTYVCVNVTLKNETDQENAMYMNRFSVIAIDPQTEDSADIYFAGELRGYKTRNDLLEYNKSYARKEILPNEEFTVNLVFIQRESDLENHTLYIKYYATGATNREYDKESYYVRLKE